MIIELILALIIGVLAGTFTGLLPGIHINLVGAILLGISASLLQLVSPLTLVIFIVSMAITHTFIDFIPSIFLGAPDEDSILSVLPGHQLLLKGKGYEAIILTLYGGLTALILILIFTPLFILILPKIYPYIQRIMWIILVLLSSYMILTEKDKKLWTLIIFLLSGFLGIASLNLNLSQPLLPMLTGLFGASGLLISIKQKTKIPEQKIIPTRKIKFTKTSFLNSTFASIIASPFTSFLPGLGSSQAALIGKEVAGDINEREFLFILGAINTLVMGLSFVTLYAIEKTRTGAAVAVSELIPNLTLTNIFYILTAIILSGILSFLLAIKLSKSIAKIINKINYSRISLVVLFILIFFVLIFSGLLGFLVFIISASLGLTTILLGIKRIHMMGCLLIPTILFYLL